MLNTRAPRVCRSAASATSNTTPSKTPSSTASSKAVPSSTSNKRKRSIVPTSEPVQRNVKQKIEAITLDSDEELLRNVSKKEFDVKVTTKVEQEIDLADHAPLSPAPSGPPTPGGFDGNDDDLDSLLVSSESDNGTSIGTQSDKDTSVLVSTPASSVDNELANPNKGKKRKTSEDKTSSADQSSSAKKMKMSIPKSDPAPEEDPIFDLLFDDPEIYSNTEASTPPPPAAATPVHPRKKIRRAPKPANPFRTDIRMGVSGSTAAGTGLRALQRSTTQKPSSKASKPVSTSASEEKRPPEEVEALRRLNAKQAEAVAKKKPTAIIENLKEVKMPPGMHQGLIRADKSVKKDRQDGGNNKFKPKAAWRKDNEDLNPVHELINDAIGRRMQFGPSKTAGMTEGAKRLNKIKQGSFKEGRFMNMATAYKRTKEVNEEMARENEKKRAKVAEDMAELQARKRARLAEAGRAGRV
ncbi:hypothetical protein BU23DRAFT_641588 [Bimuria novae-zelandiae CBS 107.79]|uniref:Uncharacterized protein n=1 Tax=Bimuria novae-zelandiae CBS 107.79 TaxID=1447943 RepID=A0A6A5VAU2_9PLEO|nr:hypothetical protein BU23DRAFT_641588 [Bimuria novae-zelandiae CBS 107.79]